MRGFSARSVRALVNRRGGRGLLATAASAVALLIVAPAALADFTWAGASTSPNWSVATNWVGGVSPTTGPEGNLTFPDLSSNPACTATPPTATCYTSTNNVTGIAANSLAFTNTTAGTGYRLLGQQLTVGAGGIQANSGNSTSTTINSPLTLGAAQTWTIGMGPGAGYNSLTLAAGGGVTGSPSALGVAFPALSRGDLFVDSDVEVGPVTASGVGGLHLGTAGSVNAADGQPVTINGGSAPANGATLVAANPGAKTGPLTVNGNLQIGSSTSNGTLGVTGAASLPAGSATTMYVNNDGAAPGADYSQLSAASASLGGTLHVAQNPAPGCVALTPGDTATLVTTSGALTGTFSNAPNGAVISMSSSCQSPAPRVQIEYGANSVTATVVTSPTATSLAASPTSSATNQPVTLTATVNDTSGSTTQSGTVAFSNKGVVIPGCASQPVSGSGTSATATCTTAFSADTSPESLTATFAGSSGSGSSATGSAQSLTVNRASASTSVAASTVSPTVGANVTYTATVTPGYSGARVPSGAVQFLDAGKPIAGCTGQPLQGSSSCTIAYPSAGPHSISAAYGGDGNFGGSSSSAVNVNVQAPAPGTRGSNPGGPGSNPGGPGSNPGGSGSNPGPSASATTARVSHVATTRATLRGSIATNGAAVSWQFQYGRRSAYGQTTRAQTIAAGRNGPVSISQVVKGLSPNVRYHYRLVVYTNPATGPARRANGKDITFKTGATGKVALAAGPLAVLGRVVSVAQKCQSGVRCVGKLSITTTQRRGKRNRTVACATGSFAIKAHRTATVRARVTGACLTLLQSAPQRRMAARLSTQTQSGQVGVTKKVTLQLR